MLGKKGIRVGTAVSLAALLMVVALGTASGQAAGAPIELQVSGLPTGPDGVWTSIEWLDPYINQWTEVDGWQGTLETDGTQQWWVGSSDFGTGPFRWQVFSEQGGDLLGRSDNFDLPEHSNDVVIVQMEPLGQQ